MSFVDAAIQSFPAPIRAAILRAREPTINGRLARGIIWGAAGAAGSKGLTLLASILVARLLGQVGFGAYGTIQSTVGTLQVLATMGLGVAVTKHVAELRRIDPERGKRVISLSMLASLVSAALMTVALLLGASFIAKHVLAAPALVPSLRFSAGVVLFGTLVATQGGALAGYEAFGDIARVNVWTGVASIALLAGCTYALGLEGAVVALGLTQAVSWILNGFALRRRAGRMWLLGGLELPSRDDWLLLRDYSLPALLTTLLVALGNWVCVALLVNRPDGYAEMGLFSAANQWLIALMFLPTIIGQVCLPVVASAQATGEGAARVLRQSLVMSAIVSVPLVVGAILLSPLILRAYGPAFGAARVTFVVVLVTAGVMAVQTPVGQVLAGTGKMWMLFWMNLGWFIVFVGATMLGVGWGAVGLASARLIAYLAHSVWTYWGARRVLTHALDHGRQ